MRSHITRIVCLGVLLYGAFAVQQDVVEDTSTTQKACDSYSRLLGSSRNSEALEKDYPWMVALGYRDERNNTSFRCSGTIISEYFILTTANCTTANCTTASNRPAFIRTGTYILRNDETEETDGLDYQVDAIIRHENYDPLKILHDIALIRVTAKIVFSHFVRPACLYTDLKDVDKNVKLVIGGWGETSEQDNSAPNTLQIAEVATVPLSECNRTVLELNKLSKDSAFRNGLSPSHYCAADPDTESSIKKDACHGDEGGPIQLYPDGVCKVVGIISKVSCGSAWPGIYTRVAYYLDWIESKVWPNGFNRTSLHIDVMNEMISFEFFKNP